jgi:RNA polymerase sigma-70 factor (ECF subfamily)
MDPKDLFETNALLGRAQAGDERAMEVLYDRYIQRVESWARGQIPRQARGVHDTTGVAHDVLVRSLLTASGEGHEIRSSFRAYVRQALRNRLSNLSRGKSLDFEQLSDGIDSDEPSALERLLSSEVELHLSQCIDSLAREKQELLYLRFERELPFSQIADLLGLDSEDAARMRVNRAISGLRESLQSID